MRYSQTWRQISQQFEVALHKHAWRVQMDRKNYIYGLVLEDQSFQQISNVFGLRDEVVHHLLVSRYLFGL